MAQELKAYRDPKEGPCWREFYEKSEVDAVLAEKDKEIAERKEKYNELAKLHDKAIQACCDADKVIAHQKYKRCLAMAKWCASRSASWCLDPADDELHKSDFYDKWKLRWLELAEKFKEVI